MIRSQLLQRFPWVRHGFGNKETALPDPMPWRLRQIHSDRWHELDASVSLPSHNSLHGDGIVTASSKLPIGIHTADCVPLLMVAPDRDIVAAVHAGWRGTAKQITRQIVQSMRNQHQISIPELTVALGPCIRSCCYEVGEEVADRFEGASFLQKKRGKYTLDLAEANRQQLLECGVQERHIEVIDYCTSCRKDLFYSYRRDGPQTGRNISWIEMV